LVGPVRGYQLLLQTSLLKSTVKGITLLYSIIYSNKNKQKPCFLFSDKKFCGSQQKYSSS
jgi:hypothetical protein